MRDSRLRTLVRLTFANPASLVYLGLVAVTALPLVLTPAIERSGFEAVWLFFVTAPTSMLLLLPDVTDGDSGLAIGYFTAALALAALLHSFLLGLAYRAVRGGRTREARTTA
ncbi:SCO4225 family membrane protein [Streptomyces sp. NPDC057540]|uniref:SCO4225 family membrane protein n=1 Tax=Streptomyces sp. NPDC057540 TaxID=3346160 RepID=UPI0036CACD7D